MGWEAGIRILLWCTDLKLTVVDGSNRETNGGCHHGCRFQKEKQRRALHWLHKEVRKKASVQQRGKDLQRCTGGTCHGLSILSANKGHGTRWVAIV